MVMLRKVLRHRQMKQGQAELGQKLLRDIHKGLLSIDEARQMMGLDPWNLPGTSGMPAPRP